MNPGQLLGRGVAELGLAVPQDSQKRLLAYLDLIAKWNRVHNLTAIRDIPSMVSAHLLDSLAVVPHLSAATVLDVGSGGGFPGIPLAMLWPESQITVLDSNQKKTTFLQQAKIELELKNLTVVCARVEVWQSENRYALVISRAFAELAEFVQWTARFCADGGTLAAMKGILPKDEIARLPPAYKVRKVIPLRVPGLDAERHLVLIDP